MDRFIKKNMFLVGVLGLSALGVLVLLVLSIVQHAEMRKHIRGTAEMRKTNETLMRQKPPAIFENIALIEKDIEGYSDAAEELKYYLGQPLRPALEAFADKLGVAETKLTAMFKEFWEREKQSQGPREQTYRRFRATRGKLHDGDKELWTPDSWDEAMESFIEKAQTMMMEKIDERNTEEFFLSSLGLLRNLGNSQQRLDVFARTMQSQIVDLLSGKNVKMLGIYFTGTGISPVKSDADFSDQGERSREAGVESARSGGSVSERMSNAEGNTQTAGIEPSDTIRNWEIMGDLAKRIAGAGGIESLERLSFGNLAGRQENGCTFYTYEFTVQGSQRSLRKLLNDLGMAYKENRVYVVRNFSLHKLEDQTQDLIDMAQGILSVPTAEKESSLELGDGDMPGAPLGGVERGRARRLPATLNYFKEQIPYIYGEIVTGRNDLCSATFVVDYVVYSANVLK